MKFMLIVIITMGAMGHDPKTIEMRIPQENKAECLKSAKTFELKLLNFVNYCVMYKVNLVTRKKYRHN